MRQLLLLRHAKSSWDDPKLPDHARPLNPRGRRAAEAVREILGGLGLRPDLVLVSSARRTLQTIEALEPWAPESHPAVVPLDALYLASASDLLATLQSGARDAACVLLVSHNPGLHELALLLSGPDSDPAELARLEEAYPTASLAVLSVPCAWPDLAPAGATLRRFVRPEDLPAPAQT